MELKLKNTFLINVTNFVFTILMILSVVFGIFELKEIFSFIELVAIFYCILFQIMMLAVVYSGLRELNLPEFMEFFENGYVQQLGFILINLLMIDTSLVGLVVGCITIAYSLGIIIYFTFFFN